MIKLDYPPDVDMQSKLKNFSSFLDIRKILGSTNDGDLLDWYPSQVKGPVDDEVQEGIKISNQKFFEIYNFHFS